jgi:mitochondrial fission protein ELM1
MTTYINQVCKQRLKTTYRSDHQLTENLRVLVGRLLSATLDYRSDAIKSVISLISKYLSFQGWKPLYSFFNRMAKALFLGSSVGRSNTVLLALDPSVAFDDSVNVKDTWECA